MTQRSSNPCNRSTDPCPLCDTSVQDSRYPRHRLILEDESESDANRHIERRVCPECWEQTYEKFTLPAFMTDDSAL